MPKNITTEITIHAPREKVWAILTDFNNYYSWNPFIVQSSGQAVVGSRLINTMMNGKGTMVFKPVVLTVKQNEYFDWLGSLFIKGLFDGHHYFKLEDLGNGQTRLTQGENFSGILAGLLLISIGKQTRKGFEKMNEALKERAERG
ncbi:MAG: SRPBCC domain-containing protein [Saprospirales bacterium]|nr:SRPBCC domain-containing protein [Saprospirales bacterium]